MLSGTLKNSHQGFGQKPKLGLASRLDGYVFDRPFILVIENLDLILYEGKIDVTDKIEH